MADAHTKVQSLTIKELQRRGVAITRGDQYIPKAWLPKRPISIAEVHKRLAKIKGSLAEDVAFLRDAG